MRMKELEQWVCWRSEERGGRRTKVPYSPASGSHARCDDPATWGTFDEARNAVREGRYDGLGFVFTTEDPFCGVDLDGCVDPETGEVEAWAMEIVEELGSYTEFSPSGAGLHVIVRAVLPEGGNRRGGIELYDRGRFFTVTGRRLPGTSHLIEDHQQQISTLHARLFPPQERNTPDGTVPIGNSISDEEVVRRAMGAANGGKFARLWMGDRYGYASESEADLALCSMLAFWTGPDEDRVASLVARSGLAREKWGRDDYRRRTIARPVENAEFYSPRAGAESLGDGYVRANGTEGRTVLDGATLPDAAPFPVDAIPSSCRQLVGESEVALGCAPELVALPMLAVLSSAIGTSRVVEVKGAGASGPRCSWPSSPPPAR